MKKLLFFLLAAFIAIPVYGQTITRDDITSWDELTISKYNTDLNTAYTKLNTGIYGDNIVSSTISDDDLSANTKVTTRQYEGLGEYVYTGITLPTSGSRTDATITAGTAYVQGVRVASAATTHTFGASKTTWCYIDMNGSFSFVESATQPTTPANSIVLGYVTTNANNVTGASETARATAPPNLRIYQDYRQGFIVSYDTAAQFVVTSGEIDLGSASGAGLRRNTTTTTVTWSDIDTGAEASSTYYYVHAYPDASNSTNAAFIISTSSTDASGVDNERCIGWFYNDASSNITPDSIACYKTDGSGVPNVARVSRRDQNIAITAATETTIGSLRFVSSGRPVKLTYGTSAIGAGTDDYVYFISVDSVALTPMMGSYLPSSTGYPHGSSATDVQNLGTGEFTIDLKIKTRTQNATIYGILISAEEL